MEEPLSKPKVFLSHSSADKPFVEKLAQDLRTCSIEYWLDREEIRDGRPWLKIIFENGIPSCDAVLVYLTPESLKSKMLEKELDAAVIEQLSSGGITLLPYVSDETIRPSLRADIRALQCRVWNDENYSKVLPSVVGEIWRSYLERRVEKAILHEKNQRLELELKIKNLEEQVGRSVFSPVEDAEFEHIYSQLDKPIEVSFFVLKEDETEKTHVAQEHCKFSTLQLLFSEWINGYRSFSRHSVSFTLRNALKDLPPDNNQPNLVRGHGSLLTDPSRSLQTYGLVKPSSRDKHAHDFTEKFYRFIYWLEYNQREIDFVPKARMVEAVPVQPPVPVRDQSIEYAKQVDNSVSILKQKHHLLTSAEGVELAKTELNLLFRTLHEKVKKSNGLLKNIRLKFESHGAKCLISSENCILELVWDSEPDCLDNAQLFLTVSRNSSPQEEAVPVFSYQFAVKITNSLKIVWRSNQPDTESTDKLADLSWRTLFSAIQGVEESL